MSEFYTPEELAAFLKVEERTVSQWLREGILPGRKIGGKTWRVSKKEFEEWVKYEGKKSKNLRLAINTYVDDRISQWGQTFFGQSFEIREVQFTGWNASNRKKAARLRFIAVLLMNLGNERRVQWVTVILDSSGWIVQGTDEPPCLFNFQEKLKSEAVFAAIHEWESINIGSNQAPDIKRIHSPRLYSDGTQAWLVDVAQDNEGVFERFFLLKQRPSGGIEVDFLCLGRIEEELEQRVYYSEMNDRMLLETFLRTGLSHVDPNHLPTNLKFIKVVTIPNDFEDDLEEDNF